MGYLIGFILAAFFSGYINYSKNIFTNFMKIIFATSFIYLSGVLWLGAFLGWDKPIFDLGVKPFLLAELFKVTLLSLILPKIIKIRKFI